MGLPADVAARWPWNRRSAPTSLAENIDGMPEDDDLNYALMALLVLETHGRGFTSADVAQAWLDWLPGGRVFTAERVAYRNLLLGLPAGHSAAGTTRSGNGSARRSAPTCTAGSTPAGPAARGRAGLRDATVSHVRGGVYGAIWAAALARRRPVAADVDEVLDAGRVGAAAAQPVRRHRPRGAALGARRATGSASSTALRTARPPALGARPQQRGAGGRGPGVRPGDLERSICAVVSGGWDTDSTGATVGSVDRSADRRRRRCRPRGSRRCATGWPPASPASTGSASTSWPRGPGRWPATKGARSPVAVVGSANMDLVGHAPRLPPPGETVLGDDFAHDSRRQGRQPGRRRRPGRRRAATFVGAVGDDAFGVALRASLTARRRGLRAGCAPCRPVRGRADRGGPRAAENFIVVAPGANGTLDRAGRRRDRAAIAGGDVLLCQLEVPLPTVVAAAHRAPAPAARRWCSTPRRPARCPPSCCAVDLLVVNERRGGGRRRPPRARRSLLGAACPGWC